MIRVVQDGVQVNTHGMSRNYALGNYNFVALSQRLDLHNAAKRADVRHDDVHTWWACTFGGSGSLSSSAIHLSCTTYVFAGGQARERRVEVLAT